MLPGELQSCWYGYNTGLSNSQYSTLYTCPSRAAVTLNALQVVIKIGHKLLWWRKVSTSVSENQSRGVTFLEEALFCSFWTLCSCHWSLCVFSWLIWSPLNPWISHSWGVWWSSWSNDWLKAKVLVYSQKRRKQMSTKGKYGCCI